MATAISTTTTTTATTITGIMDFLAGLALDVAVAGLGAAAGWVGSDGTGAGAGDATTGSDPSGAVGELSAEGVGDTPGAAPESGCADVGDGCPLGALVPLSC